MTVGQSMSQSDSCRLAVFPFLIFCRCFRATLYFLGAAANNHAGCSPQKKVHTGYQKYIIIRPTMSLRLVERGLARVAGQSCLASPFGPQSDLAVAVALVVLW